MDQLHKRFSVEQVKVLLLQGTMARSEVQEVLRINKTRFFEVPKEYRQNPEEFSFEYERATPEHLLAEVELVREKPLVEDPSLPGGETYISHHSTKQRYLYAVCLLFHLSQN